LAIWKIFYIFTLNKNAVMIVESQKQRVQMIDELMSISSVMDELFRYHPDNPNKVDVVQEFQKLAIRKVELQSILDAQV
jgi:hypothetical protein